MILPQTVNNI